VLETRRIKSDFWSHAKVDSSPDPMGFVRAGALGLVAATSQLVAGDSFGLATLTPVVGVESLGLDAASGTVGTISFGSGESTGALGVLSSTAGAGGITGASGSDATIESSIVGPGVMPVSCEPLAVVSGV
jgi:hypothetical protein